MAGAKLVAYDDALSTPEAPWTVSGVLGGLGLLWGEAGVGKSFVAVSMAVSVATGRPWLGHRVAEGPVVYIAGEGGVGNVARRMDAALGAIRCCDETEPVPLWILSPGVDLVAGPAELLGVLADVSPQLVIVDTLARCFGGDENSTQDMGRFVRTLDVVREVCGGSVLVVHHANKSSDATGSKRIRGNGALYGAVDVSLQLVPAAAGEMLLIADKLRDRDVSAPVAELRFESVALGTGELDELGDARTTRVVRPGALFEALLPEVALLAINAGVITYAAWRGLCNHIAKGLFDRLVVAIVGDPETWGIEELWPGIYGSRSKS